MLEDFFGGNPRWKDDLRYFQASGAAEREYEYACKIMSGYLKEA